MTSISSTDSSFSEWSLSTDTEQQISYMLDQFVKEQDYSPAQTSTPPPPSPPPQTTMPNGLETRLKRVSKECIRVLSSEMIKYRHQHEFKVRGSTGKVKRTADAYHRLNMTSGIYDNNWT
ncbi:uncharacterized protein B0P05DRAFT_538297 [Gilbertella persicaria]|uniref:uncharacterized protein n=1 Tax=Gilbertella persicaria TaxID=101096 RepID=UPI002220F1BC|nr:uncharacterized protein B0P05DRAFT_538297 [Gilbertella persicaria]KAI8081847.1 hypothetical protein B0P05DRAFT_538297 [Gilbertella persicaria]